MTLVENGLLALLLGAIVVKPSELPSLGRKAGRIAGKAVRKLQLMRREIGEYVEKNEMTSVQQELQQTVAQLERIRQEVRSLSSVRSMVFDPSSPLRHADKQPAEESENIDIGGKLDRVAVEPPKAKPVKSEGKSGGSDLPGFTVIPVSAKDVGLVSEVSLDDGDGKEVTGSQVLVDALQEERVASHAMQFFQQGSNRDMPPSN